MSKKKPDIGELLTELSALIGGRVDLRCGGGKFAVRADNGHVMLFVRGTLSTDPRESLNKAIERWNNRSEERPFL